MLRLGRFHWGVEEFCRLWSTSEVLGGVAGAHCDCAGVFFCVRDSLVCYYHYQLTMTRASLCVCVILCPKVDRGGYARVLVMLVSCYVFTNTIDNAEPPAQMVGNVRRDVGADKERYRFA